MFVTKADKIKILVINDLSFHMYNALTDAGFKKENIYLAFGKWNKDGTPLSDKKVYNIMSMFAKSNFVEFERDASNIVTLEEIMNMNMKNTIKFDYIISNPPYKIGNIITKSVIDNVEFNNFINLMPLSCYKSKELYKTVKSLDVVDPKAFEDADITNNLCICTLKPKNQSLDEKSYEDLSLLTYAPEYREFYKLNMKSKNKVNYLHGVKESTRDIYDNTKDWIITWYICNALKAHRLDGNSFDVNYNVNKSATNKDIPDDKNGALSVAIIRFINSAEKDHFNSYFYHNQLAYDLIKGLNKNGGTAVTAIPNIDWSIDRDYEHLTLEDIMKILKDEK